VTGDVTGSELAEVCQQSYMSVMGCNSKKVCTQEAAFVIIGEISPLAWTVW